MLALRDNIPLADFPEVKAVAREYGFKRNLDARTRVELLGFYRELFSKGDALEVHRAKQTGRLLEYARMSISTIDESVKRLLGGL